MSKKRRGGRRYPVAFNFALISLYARCGVACSTFIFPPSVSRPLLSAFILHLCLPPSACCLLLSAFSFHNSSLPFASCPIFSPFSTLVSSRPNRVRLVRSKSGEVTNEIQTRQGTSKRMASRSQNRFVFDRKGTLLFTNFPLSGRIGQHLSTIDGFNTERRTSSRAVAGALANAPTIGPIF
jgi:hypothetical protein